MSLPLALCLVVAFAVAVGATVAALHLLTSDRFWGAGWP